MLQLHDVMLRVPTAVQYTMRIVSGGIAGSAFIILFLGASGIINLILRWISPITGADSCCSATLTRLAYP